jgi:deoxyribodipyrimidine photo-lyase
MPFEINYQKIIEKIKSINTHKYAASRNILNGEVSYISAYLTHGVVSLPQVLKLVTKNEIKKKSGVHEKFIQELAWREYFHRVWQKRESDGYNIFQSVYDNVSHNSGLESNKNFSIPNAYIEAIGSGIKSIDKNIQKLISTGYMHNHARMWTAMLATNVANYEWQDVSRWMYYHLLDGDLASNCYSWQWISGNFSNKKYIANQENINRYDTENKELGTYLDTEYENIYNAKLPAGILNSCDFELITNFSKLEEYNINYIIYFEYLKNILNKDKKTFVYHIWNLDPLWFEQEDGNRIIIIEKEALEKYPMSEKRIDFVLSLIKNLSDKYDHIRIVFIEDTNSFKKLLGLINIDTTYYREYPACNHWKEECRIKEVERDWMYPRQNWKSGGFMNFWSKVNK